MVKYASYEFYKNSFCGNIIPESDFLKAITRAGWYIRQITFGRVSDDFETAYPEYAENIKMAACAAAEVFYQEEQRTKEHDGREVSSEENDGYSITYTDVSDDSIGLAGKKAFQKAQPYLAYTGLLSRRIGR